VAGLYEYMREGSTLQSTGIHAGLGAGGQYAGDILSRVASGVARYAAASKAGDQVLKTTSRWAKEISETGTGRGMIDKINQSALMTKLGRVFGIDDMSELGGKQLADAAENIGKVYDEALVTTKPVVSNLVKKQIESIDSALLPGKNRLLAQADNLGSPAKLRELHKALRTKAGSNPNIADELKIAQDALEKAAGDAGANIDLLGKANQRWKVLRTIEETPDAWIDGALNPRQLATKFGRESNKGFGTSVKRAGRQLDDDVQPFIDDILSLADSTGPNSGTATRGTSIAAQSAPWIAALATGDVATGGLTALGLLGAREATGLASIGMSSPAVGTLLGVALREGEKRR
jgi:hypothetical protein